MILTEVLGLAIGSGDDVGSLNLIHLKAVLETILEKLEINDANVTDSKYHRTPIDSNPEGQSGDDGVRGAGWTSIDSSPGQSGQGQSRNDVGRGADGTSAEQIKQLQDRLDALGKLETELFISIEHILEQTLDQMNRPDSPNALLEDAKEGGELIKKDWEVTKLKKRVDANEEGIERLNNLLESLAKQMKNLEDRQNDTVNPVGKIFLSFW